MEKTAWMPKQFQTDVAVWQRTSRSELHSPFELLPDSLLMDALDFLSDAARRCRTEDMVEVASIGSTEVDNLWIRYSGTWPNALILGEVEKGAPMQYKITMLETLGLPLTLLMASERG